MDNILFELLKAVVTVAIALIARYLIPLIKSEAKLQQLDQVKEWVQDAVLAVQQVHWSKDGESRKTIVVDMLENLLEEHGIEISADQLDTLIEAAVKTMKMEENKGLSELQIVQEGKLELLQETAEVADTPEGKEA